MYMSVTSLLKLADVRKQLDRLVPDYPRRISAPLVAPPVTRSYALVGTAFDYALRFELERRCPHVQTKPWVAEAAMNVWQISMMTLTRAETILMNARCDVSTYVKDPAPSVETRATMAAHAIHLAKLDAVYRAAYVDPNMDIAESGDVDDVMRLLDIAPYEELTNPSTLWLNPTFGRYSEIVGGADCDLVSGDRLIDVKVTKNDAILPNYMRQLVSYAILGRGVRNDDPTWPSVRHIGIYFARHGHLWTLPSAAIFENPAYEDVEAWYFERATKEFGMSG